MFGFGGHVELGGFVRVLEAGDDDVRHAGVLVDFVRGPLNGGVRLADVDRLLRDGCRGGDMCVHLVDLLLVFHDVVDRVGIFLFLFNDIFSRFHGLSVGLLLHFSGAVGTALAGGDGERLLLLLRLLREHGLDLVDVLHELGDVQGLLELVADLLELLRRHPLVASCGSLFDDGLDGLLLHLVISICAFYIRDVRLDFVGDLSDLLGRQADDVVVRFLLLGALELDLTVDILLVARVDPSVILFLIRRLFVGEVLELLLGILLLLLLLVLDGLAGSLMYLLLGVLDGILVFCLGLSLHLGLDWCLLVLRLVVVLVAVLGLLAVVAVLLMKLLAFLRSRFLLLGLFIVLLFLGLRLRLLLVSVSLLGLLLFLFDVAGVAPRVRLDDLRLLLHLIEVLVNLLADVRNLLSVGFLRLLESALDLLGSLGEILSLLLEMLLHLFGLALLLQLFGHLLVDDSLLGGNLDLLVALGLTHRLLLLDRLLFLGHLFGLVLLLLDLVVHSVGGMVLDFLDHLRSLLHDMLQLVALLDNLLDLVLDEALEVLLLRVVLDGLGLDLQLIVDVSDLFLDLIISNGLLVVMMALVLPRLLDKLLDDRLVIGRFVGLNQVFMVMMPLLMMHC